MRVCGCVRQGTRQMIHAWETLERFSETGDVLTRAAFVLPAQITRLQFVRWTDGALLFIMARNCCCPLVPLSMKVL